MYGEGSKEKNSNQIFKKKFWNFFFEENEFLKKIKKNWKQKFGRTNLKKNVINLFLCISMAYNVISCIKVAEITQTLKITDFTM